MTDEQYRLCEREEGIIPWDVHDWLVELADRYIHIEDGRFSIIDRDTRDLWELRDDE